MHRIAQKYKQFCNNTSITYVDLVQEGTIGLIIARRKFRPDKGARFSTYANYWIRAKIMRLLDRHYSTIHVTYSASAEYNKIIKKYGSIDNFRGSLYQTMDELIDKISVEYRKGKISEPDYKKFVDILQARSPLNFTHIPLDVINADNQDHRDDHTDRRLGIDIIKHLQQVDTVDKILARKSTVLRILEILDAEELRLIKLYHGLETGREHTYKEIAEIFKCSKQKAHQWHQRIIKKLRTRLKEICQDDGIDQKELICDN